MVEPARRARVERVLAAARLLAERDSDAGQALRRELLQTTGLSAAGVELGLGCLETQPSERELGALLAATPEAPHAHVLLSGNVFVAALRAIAIACAASMRVSVRHSRRDPALARALARLLPDLVELVEEDLAPQAGDHLWAYGTDETLHALKGRLRKGVWFHGHGNGVGAVVVEPKVLDLASAARRIALDTVVFDQRGCLSPRAVLVVGSAEQTREVALALTEALKALDVEVPLGPQSAAERASARREAAAARYACELFETSSGWVALAQETLPLFPGQARCLSVMRTLEPQMALLPLLPFLTCVGSAVSEPLATRLRGALPGARHAALGEMQHPPLDGPVDLRHGTRGELIR
ncbi:MAG TPA: acyl-CoA reductase [Polyangiaceae bacterium]|nr:acyl-CoA reductase [Polyangiaceae bacterium]